MCKHEIIIDRYSLCGHREWLNYTGKKLDCEDPTCLTSPNHVHATRDCGCPQYVEDMETLRTVHESLCSSCKGMKTISKM